MSTNHKLYFERKLTKLIKTVKENEEQRNEKRQKQGCKKKNRKPISGMKGHQL